ncbi:MAG: bifunctional alpha/beta hydrolase/OsmC family protein [Myxococcota bacterium]
MSTQVEKVTFPGAHGHDLVGQLHRPSGEPVACALFAHCFTCSKDLRAVRRISTALVERGVAVLRFDFTGLGESGGDFSDTNFSSNIDDLVAAAEYLAEHIAPPALLVGHSLGGAAALSAAHRIDACVAIATIGAPSDPAHVEHLLSGSIAELERDGEAEVLLEGRPFRIKKQFLEDIREHCAEDRIRALGRALLVLHSPQDSTVGIDNASRIFLAARHPKSFVTLDKADHLLTNPADARYVGSVIAAWASRYIGGAPKAATTDASVPHGQAVVRGGPTGFANDIVTGGHVLRADEPTTYGGTNTGPSPYELLLASLGACTSMTLRMYADRKKWPLEGIQINLQHDKIHASDCAECETRTGKIDDIRKQIRLTGPLDDTQRARLMEIADRCPVHRTLHSEVRITSTLVED